MKKCLSVYVVCVGESWGNIGQEVREHWTTRGRQFNVYLFFPPFNVDFCISRYFCLPSECHNVIKESFYQTLVSQCQTNRIREGYVCDTMCMEGYNRWPVHLSEQYK